MTVCIPKQMVHAPHDTQRHRVYALDRLMWSPRLDDTKAYSEIIPIQDWSKYCEFLFTDGLRNPYQHQTRRSRRSATLRIETLPYLGYAFAHLRTDHLQVSPDLTQLWVALHEVSHLLVPNSIRAPHYWRWMSVYMQMIERHVGSSFAEVFRACAIGHSVQSEPHSAAY